MSSKTEVEVHVRERLSTAAVSELLNRTVSMDRKQGEKIQFSMVQADASEALPIPLFTNPNYLYVQGTYDADDPAFNIVAGDPAPIEVQINGSGVWQSVDNHISLGGAITACLVRVKQPVADPPGTRLVNILAIVGAAG